MFDFKRRIKQIYHKKGIKTDVGLLPDTPYRYSRKGICISPWLASVFINVKGELTPCCALPEFGMSNVHSVDFAKAWNGKIRKFRKAILQGKYPMECCSLCGYCSDEQYKTIKGN